MPSDFLLTVEQEPMAILLMDEQKCQAPVAANQAGMAGRPPSPRPPRVVQRLERRARRYRERDAAARAEREKLHDEIRRAAADGLSHQAISEVLAGEGLPMSRATVQRIVAEAE
jgi:hypothetical protein